MWAYYNEIDPYAAAWLHNLIKAGLIADGEVDERDIRDVTPGDVNDFTQCHFFAGIGGWSLALRLAGWPDELPIWTGSCPCQPFSAAGKGAGFDDQRHLWPAWFWLISQCRPPVIIGEQVAAKAVEPWIDLVSTDLEAVDYRVGAIAFPAASVGAPHIRDRLSFVADAAEPGRGQQPERNGRAHRRPATEPGRLRDAGELGDASSEGSWRDAGTIPCPQGEGQSERGGVGHQPDQPVLAGATCELGDAEGLVGRIPARSIREQNPQPSGAGRTYWSAADWLHCRDGKARPTQPGLFPLAHGVSGRVAVRRTLQQGEAEVQEEHWYNRSGALRAFGNAIVPQAQAEFFKAAIAAMIEGRP